jgi:hypothetical protein
VDVFEMWKSFLFTLREGTHERPLFRDGSFFGL